MGSVFESCGSRGRRWGLSWALLLVALTPMAGSSQGWIEPPGILRGTDVVKIRSSVQVTVEGRVARVEVTEWFENRGARVAEGHYLYPLPGEAVFEGFSLFQGDAELRGEIMDAEQARRIYEEIVRKRADPALIELAGHGLLRARVFPIDPGQERKVTLRFTQVLDRAGNSLQMIYAGGVRGDEASHGIAQGLESSFELTVEDGDRFLEPFSPTHSLSARRSDGCLMVRIDEALIGRMSLFLPLATDDVGLSLATHRPPGEDGFFMLTLTPGRNSGPVEPRDITAVLDVSGSMSGEKMEQARSALHALLGAMAPQDRFRLIAFSNAVQRYREGWTAGNADGLRQGREWVDRLVADGGTNIGAALDEAFRLETPEGRLPVVIFLTDGLPSVGEQSPERLADRAEARAGRARVFAFGVGHDVNTHLLDRLGEAGRGSTQYVEPGENVERAVGLLAAKVQHPVLTDLDIAGAPVRLSEMYPIRLPDLFAGEELVLFGRYEGQGEGTLTLEGRRAGRAEGFGVGADFARTVEANAYIPRLWASRKLGHLTRQIWTEGETRGLVEEIRSLALRYGLPSAYTSYLVQEPNIVAVDGIRVRPANMPRSQGSVRQTAAAPSATSGAGAVRRAEEARRFRDANSVSKLAEAESDMEEALERMDAAGETRMLAGRIFSPENGVWMERGRTEDNDRIRVEVFSSAYFRILGALGELKPVLLELESVVVGGTDVNLEFGSEGIEEISDADLNDLVRRFRRSP